jgi:hypothetical protein
VIPIEILTVKNSISRVLTKLEENDKNSRFLHKKSVSSLKSTQLNKHLNKKGSKGKYQLVVEKSKWKTFKAKLKMLIKKTIPAEFNERIYRINLLVGGWINYYKQASIQAKLKKLEEWLRNRLRYCIWHHWKSLSERGKTSFV